MDKVDEAKRNFERSETPVPKTYYIGTSEANPA
jgi:hypothetical protein